MTTIDEIMAAAYACSAATASGRSVCPRLAAAELRSIITQAIAEARADVWIPIASAPLDGTILQLWNCVTSKTDIGHWSVRADGSGGEWSQEMGNGDMTHWRPLPYKREPVRLTDDAITGTAKAMPGGVTAIGGPWGLQQFARAIETAVLAANGMTK